MIEKSFLGKLLLVTVIAIILAFLFTANSFTANLSPELGRILGGVVGGAIIGAVIMLLAASSNKKKAKKVNQKQGNEKGIGGWLILLFLFLILRFFVNIFGLAAQFPDFLGVMQSEIEVSSNVFLDLCATIIILFILTFLNALTIIKLWIIDSDAIRITKIYLIADPTASLVSILMSVYFLPAQDIAFILSAFVGQVIFSLLSLSYLGSSTRVKATYPTE